MPAHVDAVPAPPVVPFVTLSREPGAGAGLLATQLVDALNHADPAEQPWTCWDRELIEKVAADLHVPARVIDTLEDRGYSWFSEFLGSLTFSEEHGQTDEARVYARVTRTIRALAQSGRVVIVGRGGVFITHRMPGGIHLRLVAPFEQRVDFLARHCQITREKATARVRELEHNRRTFFRHYWPNEVMTPENFSLTINTAQVGPEAIIETLKVLVRRGVPVAKRPTPQDVAY